MLYKRSIILILLFGLLNVTVAQKNKIRYWKVKKKDLISSKSCIDTDAHAEILFKKGYTYINYATYMHKITQKGKGNYVSVTKVNARIKIYDELGCKYANIEIPYNNRKHNILSCRGVTYNLDGKKIIKSRLTHQLKSRKKFGDDEMVLKMSFPNVVAGSIIEYSYTIEREISVDFCKWQFQYDIPVKYSEYAIEIPPNFEFSRFMTGYVKVDENSENIYGTGISYSVRNMLKKTFFASKIKAFPKEDFVECNDDYISRIEFELSGYMYDDGSMKYISSDWKVLYKELMANKYFGLPLKRKAVVKRLLPEIISKSDSDQAKINKIYKYVVNEIVWNREYSMFAKHWFSRILNKKTGSSGEINILLITMLREAGFKANPVLMSTRSNGVIRKGIPQLSNYNHCIVCVEVAGEKLFLDAIDKMLAIGLLPIEDMNGEGILLDDSCATYICFKNKVSTKLITSDIYLNPKGEVNGNCVMSFDNYFAKDFRDSFKSKFTRFNEIKKNVNDFTFDNYKINNLENSSKAIEEKYSFKEKNKEEQKCKKISLSAVLKSSNISNPFKLSDRVFPVNYPFPEREIVSVNIHLPKNYEIKELPKSMVIQFSDKSCKFSFECKLVNDVVIVKYLSHIDKILFYPKEYSILKKLFDVKIKKSMEKIILKRVM